MATPDEDQTLDDRPLSRRERKQRTVPGRQVNVCFLWREVVIEYDVDYVCAYSLDSLLFRERNEATTETSTFWLRQEKDDQKIVLEDKDLEVIGLPIIKYGDSTVIMQHATTCLWVSYKVTRTRSSVDVISAAVK